MPFDSKGNNSLLSVKGGTCRIDMLLESCWKQGLSTTPSVNDIITTMGKFEESNPKNDVAKFEFNRRFRLGELNNDPIVCYGDEIVALRFLQDYCSSIGIERKAFNSLWNMGEYEFAVDFLNKYNNSRRNSKTVRKQQIGDHSVLRGFNSEHFTIIQDSVLLRDMVEATPSIGKMPVVDFRLRENDFMLRLLRGAGLEELRLNRTYPSLTITHAELGGKALFATASAWTPKCLNGMVSDLAEFSFRRIHRGDLQLDFESMLEKMLEGSMGILRKWGKAQRVKFKYSAETQVSLLDAMPRKTVKQLGDGCLPEAFRHWATESLRDVFTRGETEGITKRCGFFKGTINGRRNQWKRTTRSANIVSPPNSLAFIVDGITEWAQDQDDRHSIERKATAFQDHWLSVAEKDERNKNKFQKIISV